MNYSEYCISRCINEIEFREAFIIDILDIVDCVDGELNENLKNRIDILSDEIKEYKKKLSEYTSFKESDL